MTFTRRSLIRITGTAELIAAGTPMFATDSSHINAPGTKYPFRLACACRTAITPCKAKEEKVTLTPKCNKIR